MYSYDDWKRAGERVPSLDYDLFVRRGGTAGRHLTLLHGFPTCSWDWAKVWDSLVAEHRLLAPDLLGFGNSDKPASTYSFADHADRIEALWARDGVTHTTLIAHDYSVTLALELLARHQAGSLNGVTLEGAVLLNGGLRAHLHRARPIQRLLASPLGPIVARFMRRATFARSFSAVFTHPPAQDELDSFWTSITARDGQRRIPQLLHYMADRHRFAERWEEALDTTTVPLTFVWGLRDPVSGEHVLSSVRQRGEVHALEVGHYPQWEAPTEVASAILTATA